MKTSDDPNVGKPARTVWKRAKIWSVNNEEYTAIRARLDTGRVRVKPKFTKKEKM